MEEVLGHRFDVLDKGFVRVVDYMGDDGAIVQAARVSYGRGTKKVHQDRGLIRYLLRHRHTTPFEMCEIKFHVKMPIFVARQWVRHRTANINEYSARYSVLRDEFFFPAASELETQSKSNSQGRSGVGVADCEQKAAKIREAAERDYDLYRLLLNEDSDNDSTGEGGDGGGEGVARELARMVLPLSTYTEFYWKCDLHNLMHFLTLRADPHAQYEIRVYAELMVDLLERWVPLTAEAWRDYVRDGLVLSAYESEVTRRLVRGEAVRREEVKELSDREWRELGEKLGLKAGEIYGGN
ncbi:MAG: FAD-dependent thymidylate synthase [Alphaproteobacteria bacterium]